MCLEIHCRGVFGRIGHNLFVGYREFCFGDEIYSYFFGHEYKLALCSSYTVSDVVEVSAPVEKQDVELSLCVRELPRLENWVYKLVCMELGMHVFPFHKEKEDLKVVIQGGVVPVVFRLDDVMMVGQDVVVERLFIFPPDSPIQKFVTDDTWEAYKEKYQWFRNAAEGEV